MRHFPKRIIYHEQICSEFIVTRRDTKFVLAVSLNICQILPLKISTYTNLIHTKASRESRLKGLSTQKLIQNPFHPLILY
jgi:hypothetical protein